MFARFDRQALGFDDAMLSIEAIMPIEVASSGGNTHADPHDALLQLRLLNQLVVGHRSDSTDGKALDSNHDISRLEAKIDILLSLVSTLMLERSKLPESRLVRLSADSIAVDLPLAPQSNEAVVVSIYPSLELPRPLRLNATRASSGEESVNAGSAVFEFGPLDAALSDELERYIFLRHRRENAQIA